MKTLILVPGMDFYFFNHLRSDDMEIHAVFPVMHGIKSVLCKLFRKIGCNGSSWFYGDWINLTRLSFLITHCHWMIC